MEDRKTEGISDGAAPFATAGSSTTASPRSSAGCSTTRSRSSTTSLQRSSGQRERGDDYTNLALLTDGLRAEREQGITIDVAYRYFATPRASSSSPTPPGHIQYTRNMVTGAPPRSSRRAQSTRARACWSRAARHAFLTSLLRVPHSSSRSTSMDLVDWDQVRVRAHPRGPRDLRGQARGAGHRGHPISALHGRQRRHAFRPSRRWYEGPSSAAPLENTSRLRRTEPDRHAAARAVRHPSARLPATWTIAGMRH
jgi:sulfate adenylyltransferase subunit 1 (EFTu-like GTPase family)